MKEQLHFWLPWGTLEEPIFYDKQKRRTSDAIAFARPRMGVRRTAVEIRVKELRDKKMRGDLLRRIGREKGGEAIRLERGSYLGREAEH